MAIEGPLKELSIQDVLQLLDLAKKTGVLTVRSDRWNDEAIVHFSKGEIVFAVRRRSTRRLGQLLMRAGKLTQRELDRALEIQRTNPTRRLAEILLEMGSIERPPYGSIDFKFNKYQFATYIEETEKKPVLRLRSRSPFTEK